MLPRRARVDLEAMAMKGCSIFPKAPDCLVSYPGHLLGGVLPLCRDAVSVFYSVFYSPSWLGNYGLDNSLGILDFRLTWSYLGLSGYFTVINIAFTFWARNVFRCSYSLMVQFEVVKNVSELDYVAHSSVQLSNHACSKPMHNVLALSWSSNFSCAITFPFRLIPLEKVWSWVEVDPKAPFFKSYYTEM